MRRITWPCDLDLIDLGGHGACRWYGSPSFVCVLSLKFVGFLVRKIWHTYGHSISRPGDLDLWPLTLKLVHVARGLDNLSTNFGVSRTFCSRLIGQHLSDALRDLATMTEDIVISRRLSVMLRLCVPSLKFIALPSPKIWRTSGSISWPGDLHLWPLTLKLVCIVARGVGNLPTNFGVSVTFRYRFDVSTNTCLTHHVTLRPWPYRPWRSRRL